MNDRHLSHRVALTNLPTFEPLEDRQLCSASTPATAASTAAIARRLETAASFAGVNATVLATAIKTASTGKASDAAKAERIIVAAGLGLPAEALKTKLSAKQLMQQAANMGFVGASTQVTTADYWKTVRAKGADFALAGAVRESLALPGGATKGKSPKQLIRDAANISLLTGDPSSPKAWAGLSLLKQGKITVAQFAAKYADGKDLSNEARALGKKFALARIARAKAAKPKQTTTGSSTPNGYNPQTDVPTDKNYGDGIPYAQPNDTTNQAPAGTGTDGNTAEYTVNTITHNPDGTTVVSWTMTVGGQSTDYTTTYYPADDIGPASYMVTDSTGQMVDGGEGKPPKDGVAGTTTQATNGDQAVFPDNGSGSSNTTKEGDKKDDGGTPTNNDKDGDGIPDDQDPTDDRDKDGDGKPDDQTPATTDAAETTPADAPAPVTTDPATSGTPTPDGGRGPSAKAREQWLTATPFGQAEMRSVISVLGLTRGGGLGDPADKGVNECARMAFYTSALFGNRPLAIDNNPGNIDYVGDPKQSAVIDAKQIQAIIIKTGGALGGPDAGKKPIATGGLDNPVIPKVPLVGGGAVASVFSTTAIKVKVSAASSLLSAKVAAAAVAVVAKK